MKKNILKVVLLLVPIFSFSQGLTKNGEGESTILFQGTNIGIDIGKTEINFGINNLDKTLGKNRKMFLGLNIKGENKEGISNLFSSGDFVPSSSLDGYWGYSFSNAIYPNYEDARKKILKKMELYDNELLNNFKKDILLSINKNTFDDKLKDFRKLLKDKLSAIEIYSEFKSVLKIDENDIPEIQNAKQQIEIDYNEFEKKDKETEKTLSDALAKLIDDKAPKKYWKLLLFTFGGINGSEFKRALDVDITNLNNSFVKENFRGGKAGLGINYQFNNFLFGLSYNYIKTNNFDLLSKKEYTLRTTTSNSNQNLIEEKKITAYKGEYAEVEMNQLKFDFILNMKLDKEANNHILINPYLQSNLFSRNKLILPNTTNIGCGFYFFKNTGKFLGGFYTELADVKNSFEKMKPEEEQNLRTPLKRLSFGIVAKMTIGSFLDIF